MTKSQLISSLVQLIAADLPAMFIDEPDEHHQPPMVVSLRWMCLSVDQLIPQRCEMIFRSKVAALVDNIETESSRVIFKNQPDRRGRVQAAVGMAYNVAECFHQGRLCLDS